MYNVTAYDVQQLTDQMKAIIKLIDGRAYIGGSSAVWAISHWHHVDWQPSDIDIFCTSDENFTAIYNDIVETGEYWIDGVDAFEGTTPSDIVQGFTPVGWPNTDKISLQLIKPSPKWQTFPDDIINSFDITPAMALLLDDKRAMAHRHASNKYGAGVNCVNNPVKTLLRMQKYAVRGWGFVEYDYLKVVDAWRSMTDAARQDIVERVIGDFDDDGYDTYDEWLSVYDDDDWFLGE